MPERVGFIGIGAIGRPMALNLLREMGGLGVHDIDAGRLAPLLEAGAEAAGSAQALAARCTAVCLSLPTSNEVEAALFGTEGVVAGAASGLLVVDLTSGSPPRSQAIAARLAERGLAYVDAGVSGGIAGAEAGTLGVMIGGAEADVARAMPILQAIGRTLVHLGPVGAGHTTKALNNLLMAANMTAASEALALAVKAGLEPEKVLAAINASSGRSWVTERRFPDFVLKGDFSSRGGMAMALLLKDVAIACETAQANGVTMQVADLVHRIVERISGELGPTAPNHSVARAIEGWAGVEIRAKAPT